MATKVETGKVKFFNEEKKYGFITQPNGKDIFFHVDDTTEQILKDDQVEFETKSGKKGLQAVKVHII